MMELSGDEVHAWVYTWSQPPPAHIIQPLYSILSAGERERFHRFHFERDRHSYLLAHGLLRRVLSNYRPVHPSDWTFDANSHGKPFLTGPDSQPPLQFNLTHSAGIVACAIAEHATVGIDAENLSRALSPMEVAKAVFAPAEVAALERAPEDARTGLFFAFWTLKEAYIKARGLGLSLPLDRFAFFLDGAEPPRIECYGDFQDNSSDWQFRLHRINCENVLGLAVYSRQKAPAIALHSARQLIEIGGA